MEERGTFAEVSPDGEHVPAPPAHPILSGRQLAILSALARRDGDLAKMYEGGLAVLADRSNPDRLALSAHAFRELMEKLAKVLDVPTRANPGELPS